MSAQSNLPKYPVLDEIEVPDTVLENWQTTADLLAEIAKVPAALIMRIHEHDLEVFVASHSLGNVYHPGDKETLDTGLYCEMVMSTRKALLVPNALKDPAWDSNPDIEKGMIAYCGLPITWPTGELFGTICVLDTGENTFNHRTGSLMERFRDSIQFSLGQVYHAFVERKQSAKVVAETQKFLQELADNNDALIYACDPQGRFMLINRKLESLFGVPRESLIGKTREAILPTEIAATQRLSDLKIIEALKPIVEEEERNEPDGKHIYLSVKFPVIGPEGDVLAIGGISSDITEHKRAEEKLASFNRDFEAFLDQTSDFIYFKDINSRFRFCSRALASITGHNDWHEMIGKHDCEVFPPDTAKLYEEEEGPVLGEGKPLLNKVDPYYDKGLRKQITC